MLNSFCPLLISTPIPGASLKTFCCEKSGRNGNRPGRLAACRLRSAGLHGAFTLIELLVVVAIIALLAALSAPEFGRIIDRSQSTACMSNLRGLGVALNSYLADNNGRFPHINNPPPYDVYDSPEPATTGEEKDDGSPVEGDIEAVTLLEAFGPYGISAQTLKCPVDGKQKSGYFATIGSSYEWRPLIDGDLNTAPQVLSRRGQLRTRRASRVRVLYDFSAVHFGRANFLYGDGRVVAAYR